MRIKHPESQTLFAERLRAARKHAGMTRQQLGKAVGLADHQIIMRYELGRSEPFLTRAVTIAKVLNVPLSWLIEPQNCDDPSEFKLPLETKRARRSKAGS